MYKREAGREERHDGIRKVYAVQRLRSESTARFLSTPLAAAHRLPLASSRLELSALAPGGPAQAL